MKSGDSVNGSQNEVEREPTKEELEAEFDPNDEGKKKHFLIFFLQLNLIKQMRKKVAK